MATRQRRRAFLQVLLLSAALSATDCLSPTLPLPPPNQPDVEGPDASGQVTLSGTVAPGANVYANNLNSGVSAGQKANASTGAYRFMLGASAGDRVEFFYIYDSVSSEHIYFTIPGQSDTSQQNPLPDASVTFSSVDGSVIPPR